jgi:hypothetical protein
MRRIYPGVCMLLIALGSVNAHAQFVPVTANIRFTYEASKDGKLKRLVKEGVFYRTENGSTLKHWTSGDVDDMGVSSGELFDNQTLHTYEILYKDKKMIEHSRQPAPRKPDDFKDMESRGKDTVEGLPCDLIVMEVAGPGIKPHRVGNSCISRNYALWLRQETRDTTPDGKAVHTLFEMYDVKLNLPPDNNEFEILHTFTIVKEPNRPVPKMP